MRPAPRSATRAPRIAVVGLVLALATGAALPHAASAGGPDETMACAVGAIHRLDARFDRIVPKGHELTPVARGFVWVEGPLWDATSRTLLFTDIPRNRVYRLGAMGDTTVVLEPSGYTGRAPFTGPEPGANGLLFDRDGRLVLFQHGDRRIARIEVDRRFTPLAERFDGRRLNSPNDGVFARDGSLYFTDPPFGLARSFDDPAKELPFQGVYRLAPDGALTLLTKELTAPNGIALSPDERTLYVSNADVRRPVWMAYPLRADGTIGKGRVFFDGKRFQEAKAGLGIPDGMDVDLEGNLFASGPGGIYVFAPDGTHLGTLETNAKTSNVAFGEDGHTLFVTAGSTIYKIRIGTRGRV